MNPGNDKTACFEILAGSSLHKSLLSKVKVKVAQSSWLFATPWTVALQASLSMEFSRPEYWSG